jgi:hypothetical protein
MLFFAFSNLSICSKLFSNFQFNIFFSEYFLRAALILIILSLFSFIFSSNLDISEVTSLLIPLTKSFTYGLLLYSLLLEILFTFLFIESSLFI